MITEYKNAKRLVKKLEGHLATAQKWGGPVHVEKVLTELSEARAIAGALAERDDAADERAFARSFRDDEIESERIMDSHFEGRW